MIAQFSIIPLDKGTSLSEFVSKIIKIVDESGLPYRVGPMGTAVEGSWSEVFRLLKKCHTWAMKNSERVIINITIDDRKGQSGRLDKKVQSVEKRLGKKLKR
ncbi:MAG: thiamine-binding protein [Nitrospirae bacterium]|nr:MAG: thiamine-binding protein [Nitrospirota bacterium]